MGGELRDVGRRWNRGGREGRVGGEDGGGATSKGVGGMVVSMAFETQFFLVEMASEAMKSSGSTWCHLHP